MHLHRTRTPGAFILAAAILAAGLLKAILPAYADSSAKSDPAESYIAGFFRATAETAIAAQSDESAAEAVKPVLLRAIPLDDTARFMLGRAWSTDNQPAGQRFQQQFEDFAAEAVAQGLRANPTLALEVKGSRARSDGSTLVWSMLALPSGRTVPVDWLVAQDAAAGTFQIIDITVAGFNAATLLRSMTEATLAETDIDGVIPQWRAALARQAQSATVTSP